MAKRPIAIACSDTHWANWKQFNKGGYRMKASFNFWKDIVNRAREEGIPILFSGDLVDHPKNLDNEVLGYMSGIFNLITKYNIHFIGINGNHDFPKVNTFNDQTKGYLHSFAQLLPTVTCIDFNALTYNTSGRNFPEKDFRVHGIPYINGDVDFIEALKDRIKNLAKGKDIYNILLIHRDLAGAEEPSGKVIEKDKTQDKKLKKLFKNFDLVLSGHIHKPQKIKKLGDHVYMLGATHQQRRSDMGCKMGYWIIYDDLSLKFYDLEAPEFKYYDTEPEDDYHLWIKRPETKKLEKTEQGDFDVKADKKDLVKSYMKKKGVKSKSKLKTAMKYL